MATITNTTELISWLNDVIGIGNSVYAGSNGAGVSLEGDSITRNFVNNFRYDDVESVKILRKGEEMEDFKDIMPAEEYEDTEYFIHVDYRSGYNAMKEFDEFAYYDI